MAVKNSCDTARNAFTATPGDVSRLCDKGLRAGKQLVQVAKQWMAELEQYKRNPNLTDKYAQDEYEIKEGLVDGLSEALRAMGY